MPFLATAPADRGPAWIPNLVAGLTSGLVSLVYSISFAALIFSGNLASHFGAGVGIALIGATLTSILVAFRSQFPFTIAGPEANSAVIVALSAGSISSALSAAGNEAAIYPTLWAAIALSTLSTGLFLTLLGHFRLGRLARFLPYPVVGGFLAGTGWLITRSSFKVMTGLPLGFRELPALLSAQHLFQALAGAAVASVLHLVLRRTRHFFSLPGVLLGGIVVGNVLAALLGPRTGPGGGGAWFFEPFARDPLSQAWSLSVLGNIDWSVLAGHWGSLLAMMGIVTLSILLNSTGLELAANQEVDLNRELCANGIANLVNGACGGLVGYLSINRCLLHRQAGARSPVAAVIAGLFCAGVLVLGSSFLAYVPKPILGGLLLYIGSTLLHRWVYASARQLPRSDYLLVVVILLVVATFGFLPGVGAGVVIACLLFIVSYGKTPSVKHTLSGRTCQSNVCRSTPQRRILEEEGDSVAIFVLQGFVFFGTAHELLDGVRQRLADPTRKPLAMVLFDFRLVTGLDSSAALSFSKFARTATHAGIRLVFTHLQPSMENQLRQGGVFAVDTSMILAFPDLDHGVEWCENQILASRDQLKLPSVPLTVQLEDLLKDATAAVALLAYLVPIDVPAGSRLFRQGEPSNGLYFMESGRASVMTELSEGRTLRRRTYTGGAILGELGFYSGEARSASVEADLPSRFHFLSSTAFQQMEHAAPQLASSLHRGIVNLVAARLLHSEEEVRILLR